jgi:hypothetical protein
MAEGVTLTDEQLRAEYICRHHGGMVDVHGFPSCDLARALLDERAKIRDAISVLTDPRTAVRREGDRIVASMLGIPESTLKTNG